MWCVRLWWIFWQLGQRILRFWRHVWLCARAGSGYGDFPQDGENVHADINVTFDEAAFGGDRYFDLKDPAGKKQSIKVHIPAGIDNGQSIRRRGKGMPGANGGKAGDLLLKVHVAARPGFERKGMDVYAPVRVPFTTAVLGGKVEVQTLRGKVKCNIKPGTQSGTKLRLRDKGIVSMKDPAKFGCHYAVVEIDVPKNLSDDAKQKLAEFDRQLLPVVPAVLQGQAVPVRRTVRAAPAIPGMEAGRHKRCRR